MPHCRREENTHGEPGRRGPEAGEQPPPGAQRFSTTRPRTAPAAGPGGRRQRGRGWEEGTWGGEASCGHLGENPFKDHSLLAEVIPPILKARDEGDCGNFAVLVDVHILPQGSSKDTSWFSDHEKEQKEEVSSGTCEYFTESAENRKLKISLNEKIKQDILKEIVKRTKKRKSSMNKPQTSKESKKVDLGSVDSQTENRKNDCQTSTSPQSEVKCRSTGQLKDCINTAESNLELPILEMENNVNQRQPEDTSSQQKPHSVERLKSRLLSKNPPCSYESALLDPKQNQKVTKTQAQQESCGSEEKLDHFKKASSEEATLIPSNTEMTKCNDGCSGLFLEEKTPLNSRVFPKQDLTKTVSDEESLTLGKNLSQPPPVGHNVVQTNQNEPGTTTKELPAMPSSSCLELQPVPLEKPTQKRKKEGEDGLRKLKLRRLKKS
ncbi:Protein SLX4IP isoform X4 [Aix galericulata]|nr:Protein SLX4IP isoform X4 [Aix galericulata]